MLSISSTVCLHIIFFCVRLMFLHFKLPAGVCILAISGKWSDSYFSSVTILSIVVVDMKKSKVLVVSSCSLLWVLVVINLLISLLFNLSSVSIIFIFNFWSGFRSPNSIMVGLIKVFLILHSSLFIYSIIAAFEFCLKYAPITR